MPEADDETREIEFSEQDIIDLIDGDKLWIKIGKMEYEIKRRRK
jgi:hypothetical protein